MSVWVRRCLTVASLLAVWLVVRPAAAAAPVCDERGASMVAPAPTLDTPDSSVDVGEHLDGCEAWLSAGKEYKQGGRPSTAAAAPDVDATVPAVLVDIPPPPEVPSVGSRLETVDRAGVRFLLERPPRTYVAGA